MSNLAKQEDELSEEHLRNIALGGISPLAVALAIPIPLPRNIALCSIGFGYSILITAIVIARLKRVR